MRRDISESALLFPDDLNQDPFSAATVKFAIEDLFPRAEIEPAPGYRDHNLPSHYGPFQVPVGIVLADIVTVLRYRFVGSELLEPDSKIMMQAALVIVNEDGCGYMHGIY